MPVHDENVGVAFALVAIAGASTGIGAAVVFFPSIVKLASRRVLAGCLGFSAGVMCYVSFTEIFQGSVNAFKEAVGDQGRAFAFTTLTFFGGVALMLLLNAIVSWLMGDHHLSRHHKIKIHHKINVDVSDHYPSKQQNFVSSNTTHNDVDDLADQELAEIGSPCSTGDPIIQLDKERALGTMLHQHEQDSRTSNEKLPENTSAPELLVINDNFRDNLVVVADDDHRCCLEENCSTPRPVSVVDGCGEQRSSSSVADKTSIAEIERQDEEQGEIVDFHREENKRLAKMGMTTALAIALHNFPEGIATFVAALNDPKVGAVLAIAIAVHNIPEGLCIAPPIFYATGNRTKAFLWALLSGAAEFVAAFFAWLVLSNLFTDAVYATLFGLVAGMMVTISIRELLPTAHLYDRSDSVVTYSFIAGMMFMALSLVLFVI